jgi:hypothetical protein
MTEDEWLADLALKCRCCPSCQALPCGGCQQGAPCDGLCVCHDDDEDYSQIDDDLDAEGEPP